MHPNIEIIEVEKERAVSEELFFEFMSYLHLAKYKIIAEIIYFGRINMIDVCNIKKQDIDLNGDGSLAICGKTIVFSEKYLSVIKKLSENFQDDWYVFSKRGVKPLSRIHVYNYFVRASERMPGDYHITVTELLK